MAVDQNDLLSKLNIDGSISAKDFVHMILFENDSSEIEDIRKKFKKNFLDKFKNILENTTTKDIKKIFDPLNMTSLLRDSEEIRDDFKKYKRKLKNFLKKANDELGSNKKSLSDDQDDDDNVSAPMLPPNTNNLTPTENIQEQSEFGEKSITVDLGEKTNKFLTDLFNKYGGTAKGDDLQQKQNEINNQNKQQSGGGGILDMLGYLIAGGLLAAFWGKHIRPFLEEQFDFMDRLKGIFNFMEKGLFQFFSGRSIFKVLTDAIDNIGISIIRFFTGAPTAQAAIAAGEVAGKSFFSKLATTIGSTLLKGIRLVPVIGGLISLKFAYDRLVSGDFRGALIDVVGAIGSFITPVSGPIGAAISWGALALNAFLDLTKTEDDIKKEQQNADWIKSLPKTIGKQLMNIPFVKGLYNMSVGLWDYHSGILSGDSGKAIEGLKKMSDSPLSFIANLLLPIFDNTMYIDNKSGTQRFDAAKFWKESTKAFMKKIFPNWLYNLVAKTMGWGDSKTDEFDIQKNESEILDQSKPKTERYSNLTKLNQETIKTNKEIEELDNQLKNFTFSKEVTLEKEKRLNELSEKLKELEESQRRILDAKPSIEQTGNWPKAMDDGEVSYTPQLKIGNKTIAKFNPDDNFSISAAKPDGVFSEMNKMLIQQFENMNKQFSEIGKNLMANASSNNNSIVNVNSVNAGSSSDFNDPILRSRSLYLQQVRFV
jgi:hypothetical protein